MSHYLYVESRKINFIGFAILYDFEKKNSWIVTSMISENLKEISSYVNLINV